MTRPTRDNHGRFTGSIGNGRDNTPTPSDIPTPQHPDANPTPPDNTLTPAQQAAADADAHYRAYRAEMAHRRAQANNSWHDTHDHVNNPQTPHNTPEPTPTETPAHPANPDGTPMTPQQALNRYNDINQELDRIQQRAERRTHSPNYHPHTYSGREAWELESRHVNKLREELRTLAPYLPAPCNDCGYADCLGDCGW